MVAAKGRLTTRNAHADTPYPIRVLLAGAGAFGKEHLSRLTMLLRNEQDHFLACMRDRSQAPALGLSQAMIGLKLADAAIESLRSR
jgi:hypothetical protein